MTVEEYLKDHCKVDLGYIAQKMWPNNKAAKSYLSKKLNKRDGRAFTKEDAVNALKILSEEVITDLKTEFGKLTIE